MSIIFLMGLLLILAGMIVVIFDGRKALGIILMGGWFVLFSFLVSFTMQVWNSL